MLKRLIENQSKYVAQIVLLAYLSKHFTSERFNEASSMCVWSLNLIFLRKKCQIFRISNYYLCTYEIFHVRKQYSLPVRMQYTNGKYVMVKKCRRERDNRIKIIQDGGTGAQCSDDLNVFNIFYTIKRKYT